ncbi:MAG: DUF4038 domain-containing protein [Candidatus Azotimanducaceae bacterium]|uniref:DUF4038 domain-containing protein n=1 Tax=OM182 bacterium TaxID=2510334 RepID=A0A520RY45_9GAMM|nr:hypothetical protein [Gammaproteobacteria bacterium]RZO75128.1 MAG: DUF4038 domain-containing protein [OM182 bacterium]
MKNEQHTRVITWERTDLCFQSSSVLKWSAFALQLEFKCGSETIHLDGFWSGDCNWTARFAPTHPGIWTWVSHSQDSAMDNHQGKIECIAPNTKQKKANKNLHGFIRIPKDEIHFQYADGEPFFFLGDTLWAINTLRCGLGEKENGNFFSWLKDRKQKGFTAACVQFFRRLNQSNEGGYPFPNNTDDNGIFTHLNSEFFKHLDTRMNHIWDAGFVVAAHPTWFGKAQGGMTNISSLDAQLITRYLLARYGSYNLIYSLSGEYQHSYLDMPNPWTRSDWQKLGAMVNKWNVYNHPVSIMPTGIQEGKSSLSSEANSGSSAGEFHQEAWLDHNWIQTGHRLSLMHLIPKTIKENRNHLPLKPVIQSEGWYEGFEDTNLFVQCNDSHIRWQAWVSYLCGAVGYIYGHGDVWGYFSKLDDPNPKDISTEKKEMLDRGLNAEGGISLSYLRQLFDQIAWWKLKPRQDLISTKGLLSQEANEWYLRVPYCAAAPGELYVVYYPLGTGKKRKDLLLKSGYEYSARWFNPRDGSFENIKMPRLDKNGKWDVPVTPGALDWVLVVENNHELKNLNI